MSNVHNGVNLIAQERERHFEKGYDGAHDDDHGDGALFMAAGLLIADGQDAHFECSMKPVDSRWVDDLLDKCRRDRVRALTVAGALIAAEIDRLQRKGT